MRVQQIVLNNLRFSRLNSIGNLEGFTMTTHIDKHGEKFTLEQLEKALEMSKEIFWINQDHDPSKTPVAKIIFAEIRKLEGENYGIYVKAEVYSNSTMKKVNTGEIKGFSGEFVGE